MAARIVSQVYLKLQEFDDNLRKLYGDLIVGCDEVGRGSVAGPMCSAAVVLPPDTVIPGLNDSKKLEEKRREDLYDVICSKALALSVAWCSAEEIDLKGITYANQHTMKQACQETEIMLGARVSLFIIDQAPKFPFSPHLMIPKADGTSQAVAAASIIAKVTRDRYLTALGALHEGYNLQSNKGYLNNGHMEGLLKHGRIPGVHRTSFKIKGFD